MYRYISDTFAQQQQHKDSFTKNGCLDKQKKMFCDLIWKIRTVVRFRVVLKPIHSNLVWGAKIEKKTESSHFDLITTLATKKTLIEGVLGLLRPGRSFVHKWSCFPTQILVFPDVAYQLILQWYKEVHGATFDYK